MNAFMGSFVNTVWIIIPILLIFFLLSGIIFVFYYKAKTEEKMQYLRRITEALERISGGERSVDDYFKRN